MKATLEFNLPDEDYDHHVALRGGDYLSALTEFDQWLCGRCKHHSDTDAKRNGAHVVEQIRKVFRQILAEQRVDVGDEKP